MLYTIFCSHIPLHLTQLDISFAHLALMGSCQSQLTIIHVAILDLLVHWGELGIFLFGHMALLPGVNPSFPFRSTFALPTQDSCQFQKRLNSTWLP
jgi:hypothetical protein